MFSAIPNQQRHFRFTNSNTRRFEKCSPRIFEKGLKVGDPVVRVGKANVVGLNLRAIGNITASVPVPVVVAVVRVVVEARHQVINLLEHSNIYLTFFDFFLVHLNFFDFFSDVGNISVDSGSFTSLSTIWIHVLFFFIRSCDSTS